MLSFLTFTGKIKSLAASWGERRIILLWGLYSTWCTSSRSIRKYGEGSAAPSCYVNCWTIWKLVGADFKELMRMEAICWNLYLFVIKSCLSTQDYKYLCWKNVSMHMINYMVFLIIIQMWCLLVPTTQLLRGHDEYWCNGLTFHGDFPICKSDLGGLTWPEVETDTKRVSNFKILYFTAVSRRY